MTYQTPGVPAYQAAPQAPTNVLAVVAFVLSLLGFNIIAIILGAVALSQVKRSGERGRGFAIAAIIIGAAAFIVIAILVVLGIIAGTLWGIFGG